ncbi:MAG TPA: tRNA (adenosine(37)-N6)-threonylcarbamoyltransferase complex ATPase subunit type 1 TsaE [Spirochaetota bacterium]|nr:tRNA (adenosine(37)-N6)-threonylcarbamoyltransferase complex ATPase subunit type 1 TsaE [Spirochaetota bacterium]
MGAGKTTFIKALYQVLWTGDQVNSPTFTLANEYLSIERYSLVSLIFTASKTCRKPGRPPCTFFPPGTETNSEPRLSWC